MTDPVRFRDFSLSPDPVVIRIDPDEFRCYPEIPLDAVMDLATLASSPAEGTDRFKQMLDVFGAVMEPESFDLFQRRCRRGTVEVPNPRPIGMNHVRNVLPWLLEVYGLRPTPESSGSADGSELDGDSSTDISSDTVSIS